MLFLYHVIALSVAKETS